MAVYAQLHRTVTATASCLALWYFEEFGFFDAVSPEQVRAPGTRSHVVRVARGRPLDLRGAGDDVFVVRRGAIDVADVANDGRLTSITRLRDGDVFGACDVGPPGRLGQAAEACEECELLILPPRAFTGMVAAAPSLHVDVTQTVNGRDVRFRRSVDDLVLRSGDARLARMFLALARDHGLANDDGLYLPVPLTYRDLGRLVALSEGSVRQTLRAWSLYGLLDTRYGMLRLCDVAALQQVAAGGPAMPYRLRQGRAHRGGQTVMASGPAMARASSARRAPAGQIPPPVRWPGSRWLEPA